MVGLVLLGCGGEAEPVTEPEAISTTSPFEYPIELWDGRLEGETVVMVYVLATGAVDSVYVLETSGHAAFDSAAVRGAKKLRFAPGRRGEDRIDMWARLPVRFSMPDTMRTGANR